MGLIVRRFRSHFAALRDPCCKFSNTRVCIAQSNYAFSNALTGNRVPFIDKLHCRPVSSYLRVHDFESGLLTKKKPGTLCTIYSFTQSEIGEVGVAGGSNKAVEDTDGAEQIEEFFSVFRGPDGARRQRARKKLVALGVAALPFLVQHVDDKNYGVRWEIAKAFAELKDASAAGVMMSMLMDDAPGIRWLAGEGLINLGDRGVVPLLRGLLVNFHSSFFREGAHHVLRELEQEGVLNTKTLEVIDALEGPAPSLSVPFAAAAALHAFGGS